MCTHFTNNILFINIINTIYTVHDLVPSSDICEDQFLLQPEGKVVARLLFRIFSLSSRLLDKMQTAYFRHVKNDLHISDCVTILIC